MSYDIQVWSIAKPDLGEIASARDGWILSENFLLYQKASWQIVVGSASRVEDEDIPEDVFKALPGIQYLTEMNLEPIHAPEAAHKRLQSLGMRIAESAHGVVFDPQLDSIASPRGVKRISRSKPEERISVLNLSWWFNESPLVEPGGFARLLSTLEKYLPEAMPRRYGEYEPPQYKYETQGKEHFIKFLSDQSLGIVWYPHYPVLTVWPGIYGGFGPRRQGYRTNYISISVDASVWDQSGWELGLKRAWYEISDLIQPFFGEVRILHYYMLRRGRLYSDGKTDVHPIKNGWWIGVPKQLGAAVVLGARYTDRWSKFKNKSERRNGLFYVSNENWVSGKRVDRWLGGVPRGIAQGKYAEPATLAGRNKYPRIWPFEDPFLDD